MSEIIWYKIWQRYINGEITIEELDLQTRDRQMSFLDKYDLN